LNNYEGADRLIGLSSLFMGGIVDANSAESWPERFITRLAKSVVVARAGPAHVAKLGIIALRF
jgi:hypothetical protein